MEVENKQENKTPKCCSNSNFAFLSNFICITYLFSLPLVAWGFAAFQTINYDYSSLLINWSYPIITDIFVSNTTSCPTVYNYMVPYQWGGTYAGCDCANSSVKSSNGWSDVMKGNCTTYQIQQNCTNVPSVAAQYLPFWFNMTLWCVERSFNDTFLTRAQLVQPDGSCFPGTLKCASTVNVSIDSVFCTTSSKCPINSMVVSKTAPASNYLESLPFPTSLGSGYNLYWSRTEVDSLPISEFRVSEYKVCLQSNVNDLSPNHSEYVLAEVSRENCNSYDPRYTSLDSMGEKTYFLSNYLNLSNELPEYAMSDTISWSLYYRNYIEFKVSCRSMLIILAGTSLFVDDAKSETNTAYKALIALYSCYMFIHIVLVLCVYNYRKKRGLQAEFLPIISIILNFVARISTFGVAGSGYKKSNTFAQAYTYVNGRNCSDSIMNTFFDTLYFDFYTDVIMVFLMLLIFHAVLFVFEAILLMVCYCSLKKHMEEPKQAVIFKKDDKSLSDLTDRSQSKFKPKEQALPPQNDSNSLDPNFEFCDIEMSSSVVHREPQNEQEHRFGYLKQQRETKDSHPLKPKYNEEL